SVVRPRLAEAAAANLSESERVLVETATGANLAGLDHGHLQALRAAGPLRGRRPRQPCPARGGLEAAAARARAARRGRAGPDAAAAADRCGGRGDVLARPEAARGDPLRR